MNILCTICARGGSKGLPNKNVKNLLGKPLIGWTIEQALGCKEIDSVYISTDSDLIAETAKKFGAKVVFKRPDLLASDNAGKWEVWQHALKKCEEINNTKYDTYIDLDCTCPLKESGDISEALEIFKNKSVDCIFSVCESRKNPYFNMVEYDKNKLVISKKPNEKVLCRQNAPKVYDHVASIYIMKANYLRESDGLLSGNVIGYDVGQEKGLDIDTDLDFKIIEYLIKNK